MEIHDHFDGTAHCVQCQGPCRLTGDDLAVTRLVRWTVEFAFVAHDGWMWDFTKDALAVLLGSREKLNGFMERCREAWGKYR